MSGGSDTDKQPTLKVMRLYKPKFHCSQKTAETLPLVTDEKMFSLSKGMVLPDSFGNIYLGETFCSYISVLNHFSHDLLNVALSAKLQTPTMRTDLVDVRSKRTQYEMLPPNPAPLFPGGSNLDMVVEHLLAELGVHTLRVGVSYTDKETGEQKTLRKYYRFNVMNPLSISFKHTAIEGNSYVEAHIKNSTTTPLFFESITFQPTGALTVIEVADNALLSSGNSSQRGAFLQPDDKIQKIYCITFPSEDDTVQAISSLGRLDIRWTSALGESGRLQTQPVARKIPPRKQVDVSLSGLPDRLLLGCTYVVTCTVANNSDRDLVLQLQFRKELMGGVFASGIAAKTLGDVPAKTSKATQVKLIPLVAGVHEIKGVVVVDLSTSKEYPQEKLLDVIVEQG